jgi:hypothetical protein
MVSGAYQNPRSPDRELVERSKGVSEWAQGRFGKLRTGFDGLSPNGG